jgi:hypothetical protein
LLRVLTFCFHEYMASAAIHAELKEQRRIFLFARNLPYSLSAIEAGWRLGFTEDEIGTLTTLELLEALGDPPPEAGKSYATAHIDECGNDPKWLHKAKKVVRLQRAEKNAKYRAKKDAENAITFDI